MYLANKYFVCFCFFKSKNIGVCRLDVLFPLVVLTYFIRIASTTQQTTPFFCFVCLALPNSFGLFLWLCGQSLTHQPKRFYYNFCASSCNCTFVFKRYVLAALLPFAASSFIAFSDHCKAYQRE